MAKFDHLLVLVRSGVALSIVKAAIASSRQLLIGEGNLTFTTSPATVLFDGDAASMAALQREYDGRIDIVALKDWQPTEGKRYRVTYPHDIPMDLIWALGSELAFGRSPFLTVWNSASVE